MKKGEIALGTFNTMFSCNGRSFLDWVSSHWDIHFVGNFKRLHDKLANIETTLDTIRRNQLDIVGLSEIAGLTQRIKIIKGLRTLGYKYFHLGQGHYFKGTKERCETLLASKFLSVQKKIHRIPLLNDIGGGGGIIHTHIPEFDLHIIQVHMPLLTRASKYVHGLRWKTFGEHMEEIIRIMQEIDKEKQDSRCVIMGDFNASYRFLTKSFPDLKALSKLSLDTKSCPLTDGMNIFRDSIDHILSFGPISARKSWVDTNVRSDHALIGTRILL